MTDLPAHSPLGGSSMDRWLHCPGSTAFINAMGLPRTEDPDYLKEGTAGHSAAAWVLEDPERETWEVGGQTFNEVKISPELVGAIDTYVGTCRKLITPLSKVYIEHKFHEPSVHPQYFSTVDFCAVTESILNNVDLKLGAGVVVEVEGNPQLLHNAYGMYLKHPNVRRIVMRIVQPRAFHPQGPVRRWEITAEELGDWAHTTLIPAMNRVGQDKSLEPGKWCRFCPAKLVCPVMNSLFEAAVSYDPKGVGQLDDATLGRNYVLAEQVSMYLRAVREEVHRRNTSGKDVPGTKLVRSKTDRVWKAGAEDIMAHALGNEVYEPRALRSPAQMEGLGPEARRLVREWAYKPEGGLTTVLDTDRRQAVKVKTLAEKFAHALE